MKKSHKYHAKACVVRGVAFPSKKEGVRYSELLLLADGGQISALTLQPRFLLMDGFKYQGKAVRKIEYVADFQYLRAGKTVIEDVKGMKTPLYRLKAKLFIQKYAEPNSWVFREV